MKLTKTLATMALTSTIALTMALTIGMVASATPTVHNTLQSANDQEVAAFMATDPVGLAALWSNDFLVTNPLNQVATKAQVLGMVKQGMLSFKSYNRRIEHVQRYGNLAIVIGSETVEWSGKMPLAGRPRGLRFTAVWRLSKRGWQEVARHANLVPDGAK